MDCIGAMSVQSTMPIAISISWLVLRACLLTASACFNLSINDVRKELSSQLLRNDEDYLIIAYVRMSIFDLTIFLQ